MPGLSRKRGEPHVGHAVKAIGGEVALKNIELPMSVGHAAVPPLYGLAALAVKWQLLQAHALLRRLRKTK